MTIRIRTIQQMTKAELTQLLKDGEQCLRFENGSPRESTMERMREAKAELELREQK